MLEIGSRRNAIFRYVPAPFFAGAALGLRLALDPWLGDRYIFQPFLLAVLVAAWRSGLGPAFFTAILGGLAADYFILEPRFSFTPLEFSEWVGLGLYAGCATAIALLGGAMHKARDKAEKEAENTAKLNIVLEERVTARTHDLEDVVLSARNAQARVAGIVSSAMDAVISIDADQKIVLFNTAAEKMFQCAAGEALGSSIDRFIPARYRATHKDHVAAFGRTGITSRSMKSLGEIFGLRTNGEEFPIEASISQINVGTEKIYTVILRDISDRVESSRQLERLRRTVEGMLEGIQIIDRDWRYVYVNAEAARQGRALPEELIGHTMPEKYPGIEKSALFQDMEYVMKTRATRQTHNEFPFEDGTSRWFELSIEPDPSGILIRSVDITERRMAEASTREQMMKLAAVLDLIPVGVTIMDKDRKPMYVNPAVQRIAGFTLQDLQEGKQWKRTYINPAGSPMSTEQFASVQASTKGAAVEGVEMGIVKDDGSVTWASVSAQPVDFPDWKYVAVSVDITQRMKAEEEVRKGRAQLELMIAQAPVSMAMFDQSMNYIAASRRWIADYGRGRTDLVGLNHYELHPDIPDSWKEVHRRGLAGELIENDDDEWQLADGTKMWLRWAVHPWRDAQGVIQGIIMSAEDISARKRAENAVRELNAELEERVRIRTAELESVNKELEAFSYSVSHDLRAPLRAMDGFSRALLEDYGNVLPEDGRQFASTILRSAEKMGTLIDDLLAFSRLGRATVEIASVDMNQLVRDTLLELKVEPGDRLGLSVDSLPPCSGDAALLKQVWVNLISNAVKFTSKKDKAEIDIGAHRENGDVTYYVRDNGAGFDPQYSHKLFGVFQRLHRSEEFQGTGVGLAIVQRVIARLGGNIRAEGTPDRGAAFFFTLKAAGGPP